MTDQQPINGAEALNLLQQAKKRFCKAYMRAIAPDGRFKLDPVTLLCELQLLKVNFTAFIDLACNSGLDRTVLDQAVTDALNANAQHFENAPKVAVAPADTLRGRG